MLNCGEVFFLFYFVHFSLPSSTYEETSEKISLNYNTSDTPVNSSNALHLASKSLQIGNTAQCRVAIFGGTAEHVSPAYFAGMGALKCGADQVFIFCLKDAASIIKTHIAELVVLPYLDVENNHELTLPRVTHLHSLVVGPGLGDNVIVYNLIHSIVEFFKENATVFGKTNVIFDDDGITFLLNNRYVLEDFSGNVYVTTNASHVDKLAMAYLGYAASEDDTALRKLARKINRNATIILRDGITDKIITAEEVYGVRNLTNSTSQRSTVEDGRFLSGVLGVFAHWANLYEKFRARSAQNSKFSGKLLASYSACYVTRLGNEMAHQAMGDDVIAWDVLKVFAKFINISKKIGYTAVDIYGKMFGIAEPDIEFGSQTFPPPLSATKRKGQAGRIGIIGGSVEYAGAPYFAGMSALKCGADLSYIFCMSDAAPLIRTYSPELIVLPYLDDADQGYNMTITQLLKVHSLVIGPGLGANVRVRESVLSIIRYIKANKDLFNRMNLIFDDDGIGLLARNKDILENYVGNVYITPNADEIQELAFAYLGDRNLSLDKEDVLRDLVKRINYNAILIIKGQEDKIITAEQVYPCTASDSRRRCGGQGDILSGALGVFAYWAKLYNDKFDYEEVDCNVPGELLASYSACCITRLSNKLAFKMKGRGMVASDMLNLVTNACTSFFEP